MPPMVTAASGVSLRVSAREQSCLEIHQFGEISRYRFVEDEESPGDCSSRADEAPGTAVSSILSNHPVM